MAPRTQLELREAFLTYYEDREHRRVPSAPLVPQSDPTLLFVNAGMVPFKRFFLGEEAPPAPRATSCQKCVRAGGKHNDLENVGYTARHHTFFEMLGNFSFGDYFKDEAIASAWTFLTEVVGLERDSLWITVFHDDEEARAIWRDRIGVPAERILGGDEKDNFWSMGDTGPCGPCSEIHVDQGPGDWNCPDPEACGVFCDCDRFLEVWNLVFMQFNRDGDGTQTPLPNPSIDTGMGLERLAAVVQGVKSNYDTDLFQPLLQRIERLFGIDYRRGEETDAAMRVIADHSRATAFLIADGVLPDNEGRGYVLRRIMRRAIRYGRKLAQAASRNRELQSNREAFLARVCDAVVEEMHGVYPELAEARDTILRVVRLEEERFGETLERGTERFAEAAAASRKVGRAVISGDAAFMLYDTYGFPLDLTQLMARELGMTVDEAGFDAAMAEQRARAREQSGGAKADAGAAADLVERHGATDFVGYDRLEASGRVLALMREGAALDVAEAPAELELVVDRTPCYAESGGQLGDRGQWTGPEGRGRVLDVQKADGVFVHRIRVDEGRLSRDQELVLTVDRSWRIPTELHHTGTHMLQAALREVLGPHVRQAGSLVAPERLRFDFSHFAGLAAEERRAIEDRVNEQIRRNVEVVTEEMDYDAAIARGALAFFGEKYGNRVRVVEIPGFSVELCGGTHVDATGDLGVWMFDHEGSVSAGVRRVEAVAGPEALKRVRRIEADLDNVAQRLQVPRKNIVQRLDQLLGTVEEQERQLKRLQQQQAGEAAKDLVDQVREIGPYPVLATAVSAADMGALRQIADRMRERLPEAVIFVVSGEGDRPSLFAAVPDTLTKDLNAGQLLRQAAAAMDARGGGKADSAQGGGGDPAKVEAAVAAFCDAVQAAVG